MRLHKTGLNRFVSAAAFLVTTAATSVAAPLPGGTLNPLAIPKYVDPLPIPAVMPKTPNAPVNAVGIDYYEIAVRQFQQQVLSTGLPPHHGMGLWLGESSGHVRVSRAPRSKRR